MLLNPPPMKRSVPEATMANTVLSGPGFQVGSTVPSPVIEVIAAQRRFVPPFTVLKPPAK